MARDANIHTKDFTPLQLPNKKSAARTGQVAGTGQVASTAARTGSSIAIDSHGAIAAMAIGANMRTDANSPETVEPTSAA